MIRANDENTRRLIEVADRAETVKSASKTQGLLELSVTSDAWHKGEIELQVLSDIPEVMSPAQAREMGWALYRLGKLGCEYNQASHEIDPDEFYM